jgi:PemK-like, MazF-like toxin of type II toxin-antitoxin system
MLNRVKTWLTPPKTTPPTAGPTQTTKPQTSAVPHPDGATTPPPPGKAPARHLDVPAPRGKHLEYAPKTDGQADPGEIVWTWVPFEEDANQGKDRPVLVAGRDGKMLIGLMLSSESKRDGQPNWYALGSGDWDPQHRPSWLRLDRVLEVHEDTVRREGSILDRTRFDDIAKTLRTGYGWH